MAIIFPLTVTKCHQQLLAELEQHALPKVSQQMLNLYGEQASVINELCHGLDTWFGCYVQRVVYDYFWAIDSPLDTHSKSIVTIMNLAALAKPQQLRIHFAGFFHLNGDPALLLQLLQYLASKQLIAELEPVLQVYQDVAAEMNVHHDFKLALDEAQQHVKIIDERLSMLAQIAACVAKAQQQTTQAVIAQALQAKVLSLVEVEAVLCHSITYCGFSAVEDALIVFRKISAQAPRSHANQIILPQCMANVFGELPAQQLLTHYYDLAPWFGELVHIMVYQHMWDELQGITYLEKTMVALVALALLNRPRQWALYLNAFIQQGGTAKWIESMLDVLTSYLPNKALPGMQGVREKLSCLAVSVPSTDAPVAELTAEQHAIIAFVTTVIMGSAAEFQAHLAALAQSRRLNEAQQHAILRHLVIYAGCPSSMTALTVKKLLTVA